ncbi:MAG: ABC-2 family transporter protein [Candidatus Omnitrophica bacterium]|nr:ABC-2 family transporter protein [Candidatus Omnitrophota bacterium]
MKPKYKYIHILKTKVYETFCYKTDFLLNFFSSFMLVLVQYFIWKAVFLQREEIMGFNFDDTITYMVMVWGIYGFCNTIDFAREFESEILDGSISYKLLFPVNLYIYSFIHTYSKNLINLLFSGTLIIFLSYILFPLKIPSFSNLLFFIFSLNLSFIISFNISFIIALFSSYFKKIEGLIQLNNFMTSLFSGALLPLDFFPSFFKNLTSFFPFKHIIYAPISIFIGKTNSFEMIHEAFFQFIWILILKIGIFFLINIFYKKLEIAGG